nr:hypothetical protein [Tanacetum cinerariifolium]
EGEAMVAEVVVVVDVGDGVGGGSGWMEVVSAIVAMVTRNQVGDLSTHTTKYTSPALTQKVFVNIRRVGKGFSGVETPLFEGMLVEQHGDEQEAIDACAALTRRVEPLEYDKVAQALEITKLKRKVKKLEKRNKERMIAEMDQDDAVVLKDDKDKEVADSIKDVEEAKVDESAQVQGRQAESQAKVYKIDMDHANKVLSMQDDETKPAEEEEVVDVVTTAKLITKVVTVASETVTTASAIITTTEVQVPAATVPK